MWKRPRDCCHRFPPDNDARSRPGRRLDGVTCPSAFGSKVLRLGAAWQRRVVTTRASFAASLICILLVASNATCDDTLARYFGQLRQRGLFALAEAELFSRLSADDLPLAAKTDLTIELSRTLGEHAGFVTDAQQKELWSRAHQAVQELSDQNRSNPRIILLELQAGALWAAEGDWLRHEREIRPFDEDLLNQARAACAAAIETLTPLENSLTNPTPESSPKRGAEAITGHERRTAMHQARWDLALSFRNRAELAEVGSAERAADLSEVDQLLRRLIAVADEPLQSRSKLLNVTCLRLKGDYARAAEALGLLERSDFKGVPMIQDEITAERVRLQLALKRPADAAEVILKARTSRQRLTGELWFLQTQALISLRQIALEKSQETLAERLAEQVVTSIERCEEQAGGYWSRRCRQVWENLQTSQKYGAELDALMQQARADYSAVRIDPALQKYAQAEQIAVDRDLLDLAMDLGFTRSSILLDSSRFDAAAAEFLALSTRYPSHARSSRAHLLGTYCLGRLYDEKKTQPRREAYTKELDLHLVKYADDSTASDAYFLKAQLEEQRLQATQALPLYLQVDTQHARASDAMLGASRCYETILRRMIEQHRPSDVFEREGIDQMSKFLSLPANAPDKWTAIQADIALRLAAFLLMASHEPLKAPATEIGEPPSKSGPVDLKRASRPEQARKWLAQVSAYAEHANSDSLTNELRNQLLQRTNALNVIALAGAGMRVDAQRALNQLKASPKELLSLADQLVPFVSAARDDVRIQLAGLQLQAAERAQLQRDQLSAAETVLLDRCRMKASLFSGQTSRAVDLGQQLAERFPSDLEFQNELATVFSEATTSDAGVLAKKCWRRIESQSKTGSPEWFHARLGVLQVCIRLHQFDEAGKLLQVTKVLYPELGGSSLQPRFELIEQALNASPGAKVPSKKP